MVYLPNILINKNMITLSLLSISQTVIMIHAFSVLFKLDAQFDSNNDNRDCDKNFIPFHKNKGIKKDAPKHL